MTTYLLLVWIHFISDFLLQTDKMALNKSSSVKWLAIHCLVYGLPFLYFGFTFAVVTSLLHFLVDYSSSKLTRVLWEQEERHWFFVTIGFDQAVHLTLLVATLKLLGGV